MAEPGPASPNAAPVSAAPPMVPRSRVAPTLTSCSQDITVVVVGKEPEEKTFNVHKAFLCHYSPYFDKALNGGFVEAANNRVVLDHTHPKVFGLFVDWLYTQKITMRFKFADPDEVVHDHIAEMFPTIPGDWNDHMTEQLAKSARFIYDIMTPNYTTMFRLWVLADYLQIPQLQNTMIDKILECNNVLKLVPTEQHQWLWAEFPKKNPLKKLCVDLCCWANWYGEQYQKEPERWPAEMLRELAAAYAKRVQKMIKYGVDKVESPLNKPERYYVPIPQPKGVVKMENPTVNSSDI